LKIAREPESRQRKLDNRVFKVPAIADQTAFYLDAAGNYRRYGDFRLAGPVFRAYAQAVLISIWRDMNNPETTAWLENAGYGTPEAIIETEQLPVSSPAEFDDGQ
jgi:hypothetical protein